MPQRLLKRQLLRTPLSLELATRWFFLLAGLSTLVGANAAAGGELLFDGVDDFATIFPSFQLLSEWTIEAWVRPTHPLRAGTCLLGLQSVSARNLLKVTSTTDMAWQVVFAGDQEIPVKGWVSTGYQPGSYTASVHHFAVTHTIVTHTQSKLQFFLNGTLHASWFADLSALRARPEPPLPALLGACHTAARGQGEVAGRGIFRTHFFGGRMEEVRLWSNERTAAHIQESWMWAGAALSWPPPPSMNAAAGELAVIARASTLLVQYSCDVTTPQLHDSSGHSQHGLLGTLGDAMNTPKYVPSSFTDLLHGPTYLQLRARVPQDVVFLNFIYSFSATYNALLVVRAPQHPSAQLQLPGGSASLAADALVSSLSLELIANTTITNDSFAIKACTGFPAQPPNRASCTGAALDFTFSSTASTAPFAGPSFALQLLRYGGFVSLPQASETVTFEFWAQFTPPLMKGATLLSIADSGGTPKRELVRWWLDPARGTAVLDVCTRSGGGHVRLTVPGMATTEPQHLALSFEVVPGPSWSYSVKIHRDCVLVLNATILNPCARLDKAQLERPTIGQRYVFDEVGAANTGKPRSTSFLAMYLAELRVWNRVRSGANLCAQMFSRLHGNETGLTTYFPVLAKDVSSTVAGQQSISLSNEALPSNGASAAAAAQVATIECAVGFPLCPNFANSVGFVLRPSPFNLPPEMVTLETTARATVNVPLVAHDPDNYVDLTPVPLNVDSLMFEILEVPNPKCGHIYASGDSFRILEKEKRLAFGLSPTTTISASGVPLRFVPFEGATIAEEEAMGGTCATELRYRALDAQGLSSPYIAIVHFRVWHQGVTLLSVNASDTGASDGQRASGNMLRLTFDGPTNEPLVAARDLLDVVDGSWGTLAPSSTWVNNGSVLLLNFDSDAVGSGANLTLNKTRFRMRRSAGLQKREDPLSLPYTGTSPRLIGGFGKATCFPGSIFNWTSGLCDKCPMGTFWNVSSGSEGARCILCPQGTFGNRSSALSCESCVPGRYMPPLTVNISSPSARTACLVAPRGMFARGFNASNPEFCQVGTVAEQTGQSECNPCPPNANCETGAQPRSTAKATPGHFRMSGGAFAQCRVPKSCLGAGTCVAGTESVLLGCYPCTKGWTRYAGAVRDRRDCTECPSMIEGLITTGAVLFATAFFALFITRINITAARHTSCLHPFFLKITLRHLQMMSAFGRFEEWELESGFGPTAPILRKLFAVILAWDGAMPAYVIPFECMLDEFQMSITLRLWLTLAFWTVLPLGFALFCVVLGFIIKNLSEIISCHCCCSSRDEMELSMLVPGTNSLKSSESKTSVDPYERRAFGIWRRTTLKKGFRQQVNEFLHDSTGLVIAALILTYPTALQQVMAFLRCDTLAGNSKQSRLLVAPSLICGEGEHTQLVVAAWIVLLLWGFGLPGFCGSLLWKERKRLNTFATRCRLGLLGAEYEPQFFYWDAFTLLRRFAATVAMLSAPAASRAMQLAILLALGLLSLFIQAYYGPFDSKMASLLDELEAQALKLFCATCAVMLLGFSDVAHYGICFSLVLIALVVHVYFLLALLRRSIVQVERSIADGVIDEEMLGRGLALGNRGGPIRKAKQRIFLAEMRAQARRSHVCYQVEDKTVELGPGPVGNRVCDFERTFVAQGLAECIARVVTDCKVERLSMSYLEFVSRLAVCRKKIRLQCTKKFENILERNSGGDHADSFQRLSWKQNINDTGMNACHDLFDPSTFLEHVLASDFQAELITISLFTRTELDSTFQQFMMQKGISGFNDLSTRDRLLESVDRSKRKSIASRKPTLVVGSPVAAQLETLLESAADAEFLQVQDLEEPASFSVDPVMEIQPGLIGASSLDSPRSISQTPVEDFDAGIAEEDGKLDGTHPGQNTSSQDDSGNDFLKMLDAAEELDAYDKAGRVKTGLVQGEARPAATTLPDSVEEPGILDEVHGIEDANKSSETGMDATTLPGSVEESGILDEVRDTQDANQSSDAGVNATTPPAQRRFLACGARKTNGDVVMASPHASGAEPAMASPHTFGDDMQAVPASSSPQAEANTVPASVTSAETADMIVDSGDLAEASTTAAGPAAEASMTAVVTNSMTAVMTGDPGATADAVGSVPSGLADATLQPEAETAPGEAAELPTTSVATEVLPNADTALGEAAELPMTSVAREVLPDADTAPGEAAEPPMISAEAPAATEAQKGEEKPAEAGTLGSQPETYTGSFEDNTEAKPEDAVASFLDSVASYEAAASSDAATLGQDSTQAEEASSKAQAPPEGASSASLPTAPPKSGKAKKDKKKAAA